MSPKLVPVSFDTRCLLQLYFGQPYIQVLCLNKIIEHFTKIIIIVEKAAYTN